MHRHVTHHYEDVIMGAMASQVTSLTIVYSTVYSDADQRKHLSSASLAFVRGIHRWPVNSPHKWPVTGKMFPFDDVIMIVAQYRDKLTLRRQWFIYELGAAEWQSNPCNIVGWYLKVKFKHLNSRKSMWKCSLKNMCLDVCFMLLIIKPVMWGATYV